MFIINYHDLLWLSWCLLFVVGLNPNQSELKTKLNIQGSGFESQSSVIKDMIKVLIKTLYLHRFMGKVCGGT